MEDGVESCDSCHSEFDSEKLLQCVIDPQVCTGCFCSALRYLCSVCLKKVRGADLSYSSFACHAPPISFQSSGQPTQVCKLCKIRKREQELAEHAELVKGPFETCKLMSLWEDWSESVSAVSPWTFSILPQSEFAPLLKTLEDHFSCEFWSGLFLGFLPSPLGNKEKKNEEVIEIGSQRTKRKPKFSGLMFTIPQGQALLELVHKLCSQTTLTGEKKKDEAVQHAFQFYHCLASHLLSLHSACCFPSSSSSPPFSWPLATYKALSAAEIVQVWDEKLTRLSISHSSPLFVPNTECLHCEKSVSVSSSSGLMWCDNCWGFSHLACFLRYTLKTAATLIEVGSRSATATREQEGGEERKGQERQNEEDPQKKTRRTFKISKWNATEIKCPKCDRRYGLDKTMDPKTLQKNSSFLSNSNESQNLTSLCRQYLYTSDFLASLPSFNVIQPLASPAFSRSPLPSRSFAAIAAAPPLNPLLKDVRGYREESFQSSRIFRNSGEKTKETLSRPCQRQKQNQSFKPTLEQRGRGRGRGRGKERGGRGRREREESDNPRKTRGLVAFDVRYRRDAN